MSYIDQRLEAIREHQERVEKIDLNTLSGEELGALFAECDRFQKEAALIKRRITRTRRERKP